MLTPITIDGQKYLSPSWEEMGEVCFKLSKKIIESGLRFDRMIAIAKGGLTWSRTLLDLLMLKNISVIEIKLYNDIYKTNQEAEITQKLETGIDGETVLLFDDVGDSGKTLSVAQKYLMEQKAKSVKTGVLFTKPWSKFPPDFYGEMTDAWIVFPHERREMAHLLSGKWAKSGLNEKQIFTNLINLGYPKDQAEYFIKKDATQ